MTTHDRDQPAPGTPAAGALRLFDRIIDAGAALAAVLLIATMFATTVKVFFRYGLHQSLIGVDQISGTLLVYITFLGAAWVLRRDEHVTIDLLLSHVERRTRWLLVVASSLIGTVVCFVVAVFGTMEVISSIQLGTRIPAEIEMPRAVNLVVIPIGFLLLALQFLRRAVNDLRTGEAPPPPPPTLI